MIIYPLEFKLSIINNISFNLVAILVYYPELGLEVPTSEQLQLRRNINMFKVAEKEISNTGGYARFGVSAPLPVLINGDYKLNISSRFPAVGGATAAFNPATHIVYTRGADLINATPLNGNNIGSTVGTVVLVETLNNAPYIINTGVFLNHTTSINII